MKESLEWQVWCNFTKILKTQKYAVAFDESAHLACQPSNRAKVIVLDISQTNLLKPYIDQQGPQFYKKGMLFKSNFDSYPQVEELHLSKCHKNLAEPLKKEILSLIKFCGNRFSEKIEI